MKLSTSLKRHRGTKKGEEEGQEEELMELFDETCRLANGANGDLPVRCTRELLHPFFTDESHQTAMTSHHPPALPELRLVLLGRKGAGKSASGNTILGATDAFESGTPTEECEKRRSDVADRRVTVVDTPGWEWYYPHNGTPSWVKRETVRSVSLCPPGPHAVLLVVRSCASVTDAYISEIEEHLEPLGEEVWDHMMLLFTRGDELGLVSIDQRILTSGPALRKLLKRCGHRYQAFNNRSKDTTQVTELMLKLKEMVEEKRGGHLEMENMLLGGLEDDARRRARGRRKRQRQMEAQMQRGTIKAALMSEGLQDSELDAHNSFSKSPRRLPEVRLVLLGERETGKSSAGNYILGNVDFFESGSVTEECTRKQAEVSMRQVTVVDTPGWEGSVAGATLERVKREIVSSVTLCPPGPHAFLLTLRVDTLVRAGHLREHLELLGEGVWRHTMLLFTHKDQLREGVDVDQHIQDGGRDIKQLLEKCRGRYHVVSCSTDATCLLEKVEKMAVMNRCEAFSELVVEIRNLSFLKNERFNHRMKDFIEKVTRQELELKRMRQKEMKGILWFFDRKRKLKHSDKDRGKKEAEQEEEGQLKSERRNDISELEERIRWLTEDKEREIQDLSIENERLRAALSQNTQATDKAAHSLELKDREIEELTERINEQQLKLLDLEKAGEGIQKAKDRIKEAEMLKEMNQRENLKLKNEVESLKEEIVEVKRHLEDTLQRKACENKSQKAEMELKLQDREKEKEATQKAVESLKLRHVKQMEEKDTEMSEMKQKHHIEMDKIEMERVQHEKQVEEWKLKCDFMDDVKRQHLNEINEMQQKHQKDIAALRMEHEHVAELEKMKMILQENQISYSNYQNEKENEIIALKLQHKKDVVEMKSDMENLSQEVKTQVEEITKIKQQHHEEITDVKKESQKEILELTKAFQEHQQQSQRGIEELEQKNTAKIKAMQQQSEEEIHKLKEVCSTEQHELLKLKDLEKEELEQKYTTALNEMAEGRRKEIEELKEKNQHSKQRQKESEDQRHIVLLEEHHQLQMQELEAKFENDLQQGLLDGKALEQEYKRKEEERLVLIYQKEMEELKGRLKESQDREIHHLNYKEEMEQRLEERNTEIKLMELDIEQMKEKLQRREEEVVNNLTYTREMEMRLKGQEREMETMERKLEENENTTKRLQLHVDDIDQILKFRDGVTQWKECELRQMRDCVAGDSCETICMEKKEAEVLLELTDRRIKEILQMKSVLEERGAEIEEARRTSAELLEDISHLKENNTNLSSRVCELQKCNDEKLREKEGEMKILQQREENNKKEIVQLRMTIELTKSELMELTTRMEREMTSMIQGYEMEIERIKTENERVIKQERKKVALEQEESCKRVKQLQEQNDKMRKEAKEVEAQKVRLEQMKKREVEDLKMKEREDEGLKVQLDKMKEREKDVEEMKVELERMKEMEKEFEEQKMKMKERDDEGLKVQLDKIIEREKMIEELQVKLKMKEFEDLKVDMEKINEREDEVLKVQRDKIKTREEEVEGLKVKLEKMKESKSEVEKQKVNLEKMKEGKEEVKISDNAEVEAVRRLNKAKRGGMEEEQFPELKREVQNQGTCLKSEKDKLQAIEEKQKRCGEFSVEHELESLLRTLEVKQQELTSHGQDLQRKVKSLHDQGKDLKDKELFLRNKEQELLNWQAELQKQSVTVSATTQQLGEIGQGLTLLKEQLQSKEENVKMFFKKLSSWQQNLEDRETVLDKTETHGTDCGIHRHTDDLFKEVRVVGEKVEWREDGEDSGEVEGVTDVILNALSAEASHKCHPENLQEMEQGIPGDENEPRKMTCRNETVLPFSRVGNNFDLEVLLLREHWSTRSPAGVTILGGEAPSHVDSGFRPWRGQIAGRRLTVVEPLGLKWRDGPDPQNAEQQKNIRDSVSWCHTGPQVVLLLIPVFINCTKEYRRAAEEHVSLLGEQVWSRTMVVFTWGETLGEGSEQHILRNGELQDLMNRCGGRCHMLSSRRNNSAIEGLLKKMEDIARANTSRRR